MKIDAVITWVDGQDPEHQAKRMQYLTGKRENLRKDIAGATRYNQVGEIYYCIASILRFAPWINRIFIVTDNQDPKAGEFVAQHFPDCRTPIEIVDHRVIFKGYEQYLPTFNSLSIETMLWRIPGLSEHYILFNDDVMLQKDVTKEDFYKDGKVVLYGQRWYSTEYVSLTLKLQTMARRLVGRTELLSYKRFMHNAARLIDAKRFLRLRHTPHAFRRSILERYFAENPVDLERVIKHRFRHREQYSITELHHLLALSQGLTVETLRQHSDSIINPSDHDLAETRRILRLIEDDPESLFFCVNSLDQASPDVIADVLAWLHRLLSLRPTSHD